MAKYTHSRSFLKQVCFFILDSGYFLIEYVKIYAECCFPQLSISGDIRENDRSPDRNIGSIIFEHRFEHSVLDNALNPYKINILGSVQEFESHTLRVTMCRKLLKK